MCPRRSSGWTCTGVSPRCGRPEDESELTDELLDRYGDVPGPVTALLQVALLRAAAMAAGVTDITQKGRQLVFSFDPHMDAASLLAVCTMAGYRSRAQLSAGAVPKLTLYMQPKEEALAGRRRAGGGAAFAAGREQGRGPDGGDDT